jgi:peroxiredoxin
VRSDIVPGGTFPDYALPDHTGTVRTLSELQGRDPLILTLARGNYCPKSTGSTWSWPRTTRR